MDASATYDTRGGGGVLNTSYIEWLSTHSMIGHATSGAGSAASHAASSAQSGASVTGSTSAAGSASSAASSGTNAAVPGAMDGPNWKKGVVVAGTIGFSFLFNLL